MSQSDFLTTLTKITAGDISILELINVSGRLCAEGQFNLAKQLYKIWINFNSTHPLLHVAYFNCAEMDSKTGDNAAAVASLQAAIACNPDFLAPYVNLGNALERAGAPDNAIALWKSAIARPLPMIGINVEHTVTILEQIARVLVDQQQMDGAESAVRQSLDLNPHRPAIIAQMISMRLGACNWPIISPWGKLDRRTLMDGVHPLSMTWYTDDPLLQLATAMRYVRRDFEVIPQNRNADRRHAPIDLENRRLRIGYVSSDLRDHAIGYLMAELFEVHDKSKVEVFAYYCGIESRNSGLTQRIQGAVEHWTDIRTMSDDEAADRIAADGIDILVDINGHTRDSRTGVFARRPAPILVNWLGYPGSMGSPQHHYIITDDWIVPPDAEMYYSEKVVRLPCYQPNDRKRAIQPTCPTRQEVGLPETGFVFCCFNGSQKFSKPCVTRWFDILKQVPGSVLWLLDTSQEAKTRLLHYAEQSGVSSERLIFAPKQQNAAHLARYPLADLFLDSAPYGAHTTASDALWMGVPVLTLSARSFASRVCGSLVRAAGIPDLVCTSVDEYVHRAIELAHDPKQILAYKATLKANRDSCTLFDTDKLARSLEGLYVQMCDDYRRGDLPRPDLANLDAYFEAGIVHDHDAVEMLGVADYHGLYRSRLANLHLTRPIPPDNRIWTEADIAAAENSAASPASIAAAGLALALAS
jgi:predicted O-linked N-acetylglucosamine transferase (SPINDLY family)